MNKFLLSSLIIIALSGCNTKSDVEGKWQANWKTLPSSFENIQGISSFEMTGNFIFEGDSVTIIANGFPGCVFGVDTIQHTQGWQIVGDSILNLINEKNILGISYQINSMKAKNIELQLMEDIFVTLTK